MSAGLAEALEEQGATPGRTRAVGVEEFVEAHPHLVVAAGGVGRFVEALLLHQEGEGAIQLWVVLVVLVGFWWDVEKSQLQVQDPTEPGHYE